MDSHADTTVLGSNCVVLASIDSLSLTLEDEEDNVEAVMTFSSSPTSTQPFECVNCTSIQQNKHQKHKMFHSKPMTYDTLLV